MQLIGILLTFCAIQYASSELGEFDRQSYDYFNGLGRDEPANCESADTKEPPPTPLETATTLVPFMNEKIAAIKEIAEALPKNTEYAAKIMDSLNVACKAYLDSIRTNLSFYIYYAPISTEDITTELKSIFDKIEQIVTGLLKITLDAARSLIYTPITAVHKMFDDLAATVSTFKNAVERITDDTNVSKQFDVNFVTYLKLVADSEQQAYTILTGNIEDFLDELILGKRKDIFGNVPMYIVKTGKNQNDLDTVIEGTAEVYKLYNEAFKQTFALFPGIFDELYKQALTSIGSIRYYQLMLLNFMKYSGSAEVIQPKTQNDAKKIAGEAASALADLSHDISYIYDVLGRHITPEILLLIQFLGVLMSSITYVSTLVFEKVSTWLDQKGKTTGYLVDDFVKPLKTFKGSMDSIDKQITIKRTENLNHQYQEMQNIMDSASNVLSIKVKVPIPDLK